MNKLIHGLALTLVLGTTAALATPGGEGNNTGCNGVGNPNSPCEGQGGNGGGGGNGGNGGNGGSSENYNDNLNANINNNQAIAGAIAGSSSDSSATGIGIGGSANNDVDVITGGATSGASSNASGGAGGEGGSSVASGGSAHSGSYSSGGDSESSVGDVTSHSGDSRASAANGGNTTGDVDVRVDGDSITDNSSIIYEQAEHAAASAASIYANVCQSGGSAQGRAGGVAVVNSEILCDHLRMAVFYQSAMLWEHQYGSVVCSDAASNDWVQGQYEDHCLNEKALEYYNLYHEEMDDIKLLMDKTEEAGLLDKFSGYLVRPMALIGALIWLI